MNMGSTTTMSPPTMSTGDGHDHGSGSGGMNGGSSMMSSASSSVFCTGTGRVMFPGFQSATNGNGCALYLFKGWVLDTESKYIAAVIMTVLGTASIEGIGYIRKRLSSNYLSTSKSSKESLFIRFILVLLYGLQMVLAYWTMLLVMLYEQYLFIAIIIGLSIGHAIFSIGLNPSSKIHHHPNQNQDIDHQLQTKQTSNAPIEATKIEISDGYQVENGTPCCHA